LRADTTEFNHILKSVRRFFLAFPNIRFTLINNGEEIYSLPAASQEERIIQVFGQKFYDGLVYIREELNEISLEGYVCKPDQARANSSNQFIYLNKRNIVNRNLAHAVFQGYGNLIERSRYPQFIMFLDIPPHLVDVNVHPTKMEVRFANERVIYHLFLSGIRKAVQDDTIIPDFSLKTTSPERKEIFRHFQSQRRFFQPVAQKSFSMELRSEKQTQMNLSQTILDESPGETPLKTGHSKENQHEVQTNLWQVHNRYIFSQIKSGLVIIDQHVAHERILYERILNYLNEERNVPSQQLLFSQTLDLSLEDYLIYADIKEWLQKIGYIINELSGRTVLIEAIPSDVKIGYESKVLLEIIDYYRENEDQRYQAKEKIAAAFACKNAIKSGERLGFEEMNSLIDQLFATKEPYFCPHGRPVIITLGLEELDKKFKRV
jgi:DNA mismatch repair protein MutL